MATTDTKIKIKADTEQAILSYVRTAQDLLINQVQLRSNMETIDRYYIREDDYTKVQIDAKMQNRAGNKSQKAMQNVTVPVVMPQVEAATGYFANVWLTGYPIFGCAADPANEDAALQIETIIAENAITAGWSRQMMMFFRDGLKYNLHALECEWGQKTVAGFENDEMNPGKPKTKNTMWRGNILRRMDLYNTFFDPRVSPSEIHSDGEFAGYNKILSRVALKTMMNDLYGEVEVSTVMRALESSPPDAAGGATSGAAYSYYVPRINPWPMMNPVSAVFDWMAWAGATENRRTSAVKYTNAYQVTKIYARIIPDDFGLDVPSRNTPQVWKFLIVNGTVVLCAERLTNVHGYIPIFFGQPLEDGLDFQTKSFASNVTDMQDVASAMINGFVASKRRLIGDRVLYDPLRIREKDINSDNPAAKIPVRNSAYGKPVSEAVYQFPFHDEATASLLQGSTLAINFADKINNQNPAQQGQFVKGNKTKKEFEDVMGHGNSHNQCMAIMTEAQVFNSLKECIKLNILQYQDEKSLYNTDKQQTVAIKPQELRKKAVQFKVSDGISPQEKQLNTDEFTVALQVIGSSPELAAGYNLPQAFSHLFKTKGVDLRPFEKPQYQVVYEQQMQAWQQAAMLAVEKGAAFSTPMPTPPPEMQQQQAPQPQASPAAAAAASTQGNE